MEGQDFNWQLFDDFLGQKDLLSPAPVSSSNWMCKTKMDSMPPISNKRMCPSIDSFDILDDEDDEDTNDSAGMSKMARMMFSDGQNHGGLDKQNHSEIEKRRRDKMNAYIMELSTMLPMCNAMNRKLDKLTVLRMAVQHLKSLRGAANTFTEASHRPSFLSDDEMKQLILKAAEGFLFVVSCDRARLLYVSESVQNVLYYSRNDLIGQSLFDYLHPRDISKVKEQLSSSDLSPRERLIDARTMMPVKTGFQTRPTPTHLCSGARRSFFCQMKCGNKGLSDAAFKGEKEDNDFCHRKKKTERKSYILIHCTGYLKSWPTSKMDLNEQEDSDENCNLSCLVAVGQVKSSFDQMQMSTDCEKINVRPVEYMSRHSTDGKFSYVDQGATILLGYLPQELLGTSVYEYYHQDDIQDLADVHRKVLSTKEKVKTSVYRFKTKDGSFIHLQSVCFSFINPWTKEVEYIVSTNTVVPVQEVSSSGQAVSAGNLALDTDDSNGEEGEEPSQSQGLSKKHKLKVPGIAGGTRVGAGRIGRQIAQEMSELKGQSSSSLADSTDPVSTSSPTPLRSGHGPSAPNISSTNQGLHQASSSDSARPPVTNEVPRNGLSVRPTVPTSTPGHCLPETNLLENVIAEQQGSEEMMSSNDGNDEAAMSIIMSLLEADAGLGGPIDFNDLPWPL